MADQHPVEGSSTNNVSGESSESSVELNIKTLDSHMYSFLVDKNMPVSVFKEKIASHIGIPVAQQRLIFRGKVLKDDHRLSHYHVENGHTLHLVERQISPPLTSPAASTGETSTNNASRGQESSLGGSRNRVGQISHSMVLGTFNVGDQGEGAVPDLSRVIGAVLNSIGIGNQTAINAISGIQPSAQALQGNGTEGTQSNVGIESQMGNLSQPGHAFSSQSLPQVQIPIGAAVTLPSFNVPIPDSLNTLSEFMNRLELALSQNGYQPNQSPNNTGDVPRVELPHNARGLPTPEALSTVLRHAQRLLDGHATSALSHIAGRLEQEGASTDPTLRAQIQTESVQVGLVMQHLGALLLELGRTILTLRMGQSPAESSVNAGPAVYISPTGPNPIMVQPFPLQTSSLFGGSAAAPSNAGAFGPVGIAHIPRHINIHIHTGASLAPLVSMVGTRPTHGDGTQVEHTDGTGSGDSVQPGVTVIQPPVDYGSISTVMAEVNSRIRTFVDNMQSETQVPSGQSESASVQYQSVGLGTGNEESSSQLGNSGSDRAGEASLSLPAFGSGTEDQKTQPECLQRSNNDDTEGAMNSNDVASSSSAGGFEKCSSGDPALKAVVDMEGAPRLGQGIDNPGGSTAVPLGLGLGGLQPKGRSRQPRLQGKSDDGGTSNTPVTNHTQHTRTDGQQVLQSLASLARSSNANTLPSGQAGHSTGGVVESVPSGRRADDQVDAATAMSQVLNSPALNGLLSGVSQQTGVGSPDVLRNMLQQLTQSPAMMNTFNQIAQQMDGQDLGNMFSGSARGQGGGIDLSRMVQQMMPVVSQALSGGSSISRPIPSMEPELSERRPSGDEKPTDQNPQIDLQQVAQSIKHQNPPGEIFRSMVGNAVQLYDDGSGVEGFVDELCIEEGLADEFFEMLHRDISQQLQHETGL